MNQHQFHEGDYVIYPVHGIGQVIGFETQEISTITVQLVLICFDKDKMLLRLPLQRAQATGLRPLSSQEEMDAALHLLAVPIRARRLTWTKRCQEYDCKLKSGNPLSIAEVIRDLYVSNTDKKPTVTFAERQVLDSAIDRLAKELALVAQIREDEAVERIQSSLQAA